MKKFSILFALLFAGGMAFAQDAYEATKPGWLVDIDEAYAISQKTGKPILANFTGSDWCGWCKRLDAAVFSKPEFKSWADDNVVLLELDFPRRKQLPDEIRQQNYSLQQSFGVRGYPTVWVFHMDKNDQTGNMEIQALGKTGYTPSVDEFTNGVDQMIAKGK
ncbi:thioredoxin family protein [Phaeodactylibacter luteus]|uniref:Thioredoxin family protein n=1 Tax=Phaeodactylibacter luteus TaxID=1564516 RepID=A0A5C6S7G8_9BACT|nr:thioredoxin family protein [Phaeodactylibacter luteus]TXB70297.1 thioredoxin family protein [Phaeodactylibacter luteus]